MEFYFTSTGNPNPDGGSNVVTVHVRNQNFNSDPPYLKKLGTLTWPNDQMAERPNRMAERPNRSIWNCPLFDVKGTILKYYQIYRGY